MSLTFTAVAWNAPARYRAGYWCGDDDGGSHFEGVHLYTPTGGPSLWRVDIHGEAAITLGGAEILAMLPTLVPKEVRQQAAIAAYPEAASVHNVLFDRNVTARWLPSLPCERGSDGLPDWKGLPGVTEYMRHRGRCVPVNEAEPLSCKPSGDLQALMQAIEAALLAGTLQPCYLFGWVPKIPRPLPVDWKRLDWKWVERVPRNRIRPMLALVRGNAVVSEPGTDVPGFVAMLPDADSGGGGRWGWAERRACIHPEATVWTRDEDGHIYRDGKVALRQGGATEWKDVDNAGVPRAIAQLFWKHTVSLFAR